MKNIKATSETLEILTDLTTNRKERTPAQAYAIETARAYVEDEKEKAALTYLLLNPNAHLFLTGVVAQAFTHAMEGMKKELAKKTPDKEENCDD